MPDSPKDSSPLPENLGPYRILDVLGEGGMGIVYLAEQERPMRRRVAIKVVRAGLDSTQVLARFESERQAVALMDHPHIARVFEAANTEDGRPYFVMEYVKGEPINAYCDRVRLTMRERAALMVQVCDAIQHAHQRAVVHRDIKPSNVMITDSGSGPAPKVIDFGLAKALSRPLTERTLVTEFGQILGTPEYMSPEQADTSCDRVDTRTDVYSLGVMLYELLVGTLPFTSADPKTPVQDVFEVLRQLRDVDPSKPSTRASSLGAGTDQAASRRRTTPQRWTSELRGDLDWITMKALEKDPNRRYGSPADLARDIERFLRDEPVLAGPPSASYRARKFVRRHRAATAFVAILATLLVAFTASTWVQSRQVREERNKARRAAAAARREAATAHQVTEFLAAVFDAADPSITGGETWTARQLLDHGVQRIEKLRDQPTVQAALRTVLAGVYLNLGEFETAAQLADAALAHFEAHADANPRGHAAALHIAANVFDNGKNKPAEAAKLAREAVARWDQVDEPLQKAESLNTLANALWHQGELDQAAATFRSAIALRRQELGTETPTVAGPLTNLGSMFLIQGDHAAAIDIYREVLTIEEARPKPERNPGLATTLHLLAMAHEGLGEPERAIPLERRSLKIRETVFGEGHWHVAISLVTLGNLLRATGKAEEALPLHRRAVAITTATWKEHPDLWWSQRCLARTEIALGAWKSAEDAMEAQQEQMRALGEPAFEAEATELWAAAAAGRGDLRTAEARYRRAVELLSEAPEDDPDRTRVERALAEVQRKRADR